MSNMIKKYRSNADPIQDAFFLSEMALQGLLLKEMTYTSFTFYEAEPQELKYMIEEKVCTPTEADMEKKHAEGWEYVCKFRNEYVYRIPRNMADSTLEEERQAISEMIKKKTRESANTKRWNIIFRISLILFFLVGYTYLTTNEYWIGVLHKILIVLVFLTAVIGEYYKRKDE